MFYAFYEAQQPISSDLSTTPLLIWLEGGPGCSSMLANFNGIGPWRLNRTSMLHLDPNPGSWNRIFGLVFFDNPVGTGFSVASSPNEIPRDQDTIAEHLFVAIKSFIGLNRGFKDRPIYLTGESYGGKYIPSLGYHIAEKNTHLPKEDRVNLVGIAVGNGLIDPVTQVKTHAICAYYSGLINENQRSQLEEMQSEVVKFIDNENWGEATKARGNVLTMLKKATGLATLFDISRKTSYKKLQFRMVEKFLGNPEVKMALGANITVDFKECNDTVKNALYEDVMKSVRYKMDYLLGKTNYKVLLYQGQRDLQDGVVSTEAWIRKLNWEGKNEFEKAERNLWKVKGELTGYVQKWGKLSHVVVLGAGHFVFIDQTMNSQVMIEDWVLGKGLFADVTLNKFEPPIRMQHGVPF